jgi:hypothetical protein
VRKVFAVGLREVRARGVRADTKAGITLGLGHRHAWKRTALVTDVDCIAKALHMFAWLVPGEVKLHELEGVEDAKTWVAG